ncbi:MAG TPA: alanine racemase [Patescibacteria group bacterium]|nr:alanine racemase [Patescibacteria group bacterium]
MSFQEFYERPVWAEINLAAIAHNVREIRRQLRPGVQFCAVVKANAYGHGAEPVARTVLDAGADRLAVAILDEALTLRRAGFTVPILILGYTPPHLAAQVVAHDITQTVYSLDSVRALSAAAVAAGKQVSVHLKVDTGMGRIGLCPEEILDFARQAAALPGIFVEGIFSHFASADEEDKHFAREQFQRFQTMLAELEAAGVSIPIRHIANSAATLEMPETHLDMVRPGIILYGLWPSDEVCHVVDLQPAMTLKAQISHVKTVPAGTSVSYGRHYSAPASRTIATLPIGYADGFSRLLSGKTAAAVHGRTVPQVGRICMDQCMLDVSDVPDVTVGDTALLFGAPPLSTDWVAAQLGTINYELVCMVGRRVPRIYPTVSPEIMRE